MRTALPTAHRDAAIDWLRAIGIVLVVVGHSNMAWPPLGQAIYAFHMPLFFFLAGTVLRPDHLNVPFGRFCARQWRILVRPYLAFALFNYLLWLVALRHFGNDAGAPVHPLRPLAAIVYGSGSRADLLQPNVLWFFPCLTVCQSLMWLLARLSTRWAVLSLSALATAGFLLPKLVLPWELESAAVAVGFTYAGYQLSQPPTRRERLHRLPIPLAFIIFVGAMALAFINGEVDMRASLYGQPLYFYGGACAAIFALYALTVRLPQTRWAERISSSTVVIFPLHLLGFAVCKGIVVFGLRQPVTLTTQPLVALACSLTLVLVLTACAPLLKRMFFIESKS